MGADQGHFQQVAFAAAHYFGGQFGPFDAAERGGVAELGLQAHFRRAAVEAGPEVHVLGRGEAFCREVVVVAAVGDPVAEERDVADHPVGLAGGVLVHDGR